MSSNNNLTRDAYYNYGSYLRSRGYDQYLQRLVEALEAGEIPVGGISPGQPGLGATVTGTLNVNPNAGYQPGSGIPLAGGEGRMNVTGGWAGSTTYNAQPSELGLQVGKGAYILGPVVQQAGLSVTAGTPLGGGVGVNEFNARTHIFGSQGSYATDASTVVRIKGDLIIDGSSSFAQNEFVESLTIEGNPGLTHPLLRIYDSVGGAYLDTIDIFMDNSATVASNRTTYGKEGFRYDLAFAVDGLPGAGDPSNGSTDVKGHMRSLRGATILSATNDVSFAIDYKRTPFDLSGIAIDTYGGISVNPGPRYDGSTLAPPTIDVSGVSGGLNFYIGGTKYASIDTSGVADFSAMTLSTLDLSSLNVSGGLLHATRQWAAPDGYALKVDGRSFFGDAIVVDGSAQIVDKLILDGDASFNGALDVSGDSTLGGSLGLTGAATFGNTLVVDGDASMNAALKVGTDSTLNGALTLTGDASLNNNLFVSGDASMNTLRITETNAAAFGLEVLGSKAQFNKSVAVFDTVSNLTSISGGSISSVGADWHAVGTGLTLRVTGDSSFNGDVVVTGDSSVDGTSQVRSGSLDPSSNFASVALGVSGGAYFSDLSGGNYTDLSINSRLFWIGDLPSHGAAGAHTVEWVDSGTGIGYLAKKGSSRRFKSNIQTVDVNYASNMYNVDARSYSDALGNGRSIGFIAEEINDAGMREFVIFDSQGRPEGVAYAEMVAPLLTLVKEQKKRIDTLERDVAYLLGKIGR